MKKNELVHYHALLSEISTDFAERGIVSREEFTDYEQLDVSPVALRASRDQHEEAVLLLADLLSHAARRGAEEHAAEEPTNAEEPTDADSPADADSSADEHALTTW